MSLNGIKDFKALEEKSKVKYRTIMRSIDGKHFIMIESARLLATALNVDSIWDLGARYRLDVLGTRSDAVGPVIPGGITLRGELQASLDCDMRGNTEAAVPIAKDVLTKIDPNDLHSYLVATAKLISYYCNLGRHDEALDVCEKARVFAAAKDKKSLQSDEWLWCEFHGAIAKRRNGDHAGAREIFVRLSRLTRHRWGALHQLAVIEIIEARRPLLDSKLRMELLLSAEKKLTHCRDAWSKLKDHREAYSRRRIAEVHFLLAELRDADKHMLIAHEELVEALQIFTERNLKRYMDATKIALRVLFVIKGKQVAHTQPMVPDPQIRRAQKQTKDASPGKVEETKPRGTPPEQPGPKSTQRGRGKPKGSGGRAAAAGASDVI
jgi:tetratricopeptide (TPR) repeat protein